MTNAAALAKEEIRAHRFKILKYNLIVAVLCSAISLLFQQWNNMLVPLLLTFVINVFVLFGCNAMYLAALKHEDYDYHTLLDIRKQWKRFLPMLLIYLGVLALMVFILSFLSGRTNGFYVMIGVGILTIVLNCINHMSVYHILQTDEPLFTCIKQAAKKFIQSKRLIVTVISRTIIYVFLGAFIVYMINVFVYAIPLSNIVNAGETVDIAAVDAIFSSNLSYMIQSVGIQMVVSYISLFSGMVYGTYYLANLPSKPKRASKQKRKIQQKSSASR